MSDPKTMYYITGLDVYGAWRRVKMWDENGKSIGPFSSKDDAMQEAAQARESLLSNAWQDVAIEMVTSTRVPVNI